MDGLNTWSIRFLTALRKPSAAHEPLQIDPAARLGGLHHRYDLAA
jgi:hypothetical protein